jgi:D-beta-D-heptose 7-phosphate kinase / D-beta-D-heptose 1-phosphate adenosyltransferase
MKQHLHLAMISEHASPLALLGSQDAGGQNVFVDELSRNLGHLGHSVDIFTRRDRVDAAEVVEWAPDVRVINLAVVPAEFVPKDELWTLMPEFLEAMQSFMARAEAPYDLIHSHFWMSGWVAVHARRRLGLPVVHLSHALGITKRRYQGSADTSPAARLAVERDVIREVDKVIALCPSERAQLIDDYAADPGKIVLIPAAANIRRFRPLPRELARRQLGLGQHDFVVVYVGRMLIAALIASFGGLNVLVIGEAMLDRYLIGTAGMLCREAPVPLVRLTEQVDAPGGAANAATNVRGLGGRVSFLSVVGHDAEGHRLHHLLSERGVDVDSLLAHPQRRTLAKQRVLSGSQLLVRFDQGSTDAVDPATERALLARLVELFPRYDALIISDYGYGILTPRMIAALAKLQARDPRVVVVDSKNLAAYRDVGVTAVKPNYAEALGLLGLPCGDEPGSRAAQIVARSEQLLEITGARLAAITLDTEGAVVVERGGLPYRTYTRPARHSNAVGAGDTFLSALALALAAGADTPAAAEIASAAAAIVVGEDGTATCSADSLRAALSTTAKVATDRADLAARVATYRRQGRRLVFTNGCFDILHRGHITYLSRAQALGDILIVGVNSDAGVRWLKGPHRPINPLEDRLQVLAALSCVDEIIAFDEETPAELIRVLRPHVFVKGGDYTRATLPEAPLVEAFGGVVEILSYLPDHSTTGIIARIRASSAEPGERGEDVTSDTWLLERAVGG